jgi:hypothetical protein
MDRDVACFDIGAGGCDELGDCLLLPGQCTEYATCAADDYAAPAVPIDTLPDNATPLTESLMSEVPIGLTPTSAALSGAIERAAMHAADNPEHRVVTVLATDGLPTVCVDATVQTVEQAVEAVTAIAAAGLGRTPSIDTCVIGVNSPDDPDPLTKLDDIARAGGTGEAFIVDASQDVAQQLGDALAKIRGGSLDCEFQLPKAPAGEALDYRGRAAGPLLRGQRGRLRRGRARLVLRRRPPAGRHPDADPRLRPDVRRLPRAARRVGRDQARLRHARPGLTARAGRPR